MVYCFPSKENLQGSTSRVVWCGVGVALFWCVIGVGLGSGKIVMGGGHRCLSLDQPRPTACAHGWRRMQQGCRTCMLLRPGVVVPDVRFYVRAFLFTAAPP